MHLGDRIRRLKENEGRNTSGNCRKCDKQPLRQEGRRDCPMHKHTPAGIQTHTDTAAGTPGHDEGKMFWRVRPAVKRITKRIVL